MQFADCPLPKRRRIVARAAAIFLRKRGEIALGAEAREIPYLLLVSFIARWGAPNRTGNVSQVWLLLSSRD